MNVLGFTTDGQLLVSGSSDKTIKLWRVSDGRCLRTLGQQAGEVLSVAISPDGQTLASGSRDGIIKLWRLSDGTCLHTLKDTKDDWASLTGKSKTPRLDSVNALAFTPDGKMLASGNDDFTIKLWRVSDAACLNQFPGNGSSVHTLAFSPQGQTLASGSNNGLAVWNVTALNATGKSAGAVRPATLPALR